MEEDNLQASDFYSDSRAHYSYHESVLKDDHMIHQIRDVISFNPLQIRDKVILEIGSGPGVFAMLAARGGAHHVYAWEPSILSIYSKEIIKKNGYDDFITVLSGSLEEIKISEPIDIIFTSSFGPCLLWASVFPDFIKARNLFQRPDHPLILLPTIAKLQIAGYSPPMTGIPQIFWNNVYGFNFQPIAEAERHEAMIADISSSRFHTNLCTFIEMDLNTVDINVFNELEGDFELIAKEDFVLYGLSISFEVIFKTGKREVVYSTSPFAPPSHYSLFVCQVPNPFKLQQNTTIKGHITITNSKTDVQILTVKLNMQIQEEKHEYYFVMK